MFTTTHKSRLSTILLATIMLILVSTACNGFNAPMPEKVTQVIDISITEDMFQPSSRSFTASPSFTIGDHNFYDSLLDNVTRVELHDGYLRFIGTRTLPDGSVTPGSIDLYMGAKDGKLTAKIIAVEIPGVTMDDPLVVEINQEMKAEFSQAMGDADADVLFKEVQITDEELRIKIQVTVRF